MRWSGVVAAVAVAVAACGEPSSDGGAATTSAATTITVTPATTAPSTTAAVTTVAATTTTPQVVPGGTVAPIVAPPNVDQLLADTGVESAGIAHRCLRDQAMGQPRCTQVVHDPWGVPVSWDPSTRALTRHAEDGTEAMAYLDDSFTTASLLDAGPDHVAYLDLTIQPGAEGSADLVAVALAPGDAGREIAREVGAGNPGRDFDLVVVPEGITTTDWYGQGARPDPSRRVVMPWADRDPDDADSPAPGSEATANGIDDIRIDAYEGTVAVNGRTWQLLGEAASIPPTGMPAIERTFDGGFIARYDEVVDEYRSIVVRGWPDGTVDEWIAPLDPNGIGGLRVIPEPMGSVLAASGDRFVRLFPLGVAPAAWDGRLDVDVDAGVADVTALNQHLATLDWSVPQPPWSTDAVAFADAAAGPVPTPAQLRTVTVVEQDAETITVEIVDSGFLDDSVFARRLTMTIASDLRSVERIDWAQRCQPDRGHQTFEAELCI